MNISVCTFSKHTMRYLSASFEILELSKKFSLLLPAGGAFFATEYVAKNGTEMKFSKKFQNQKI